MALPTLVTLSQASPATDIRTSAHAFQRSTTMDSIISRVRSGQATHQPTYQLDYSVQEAAKTWQYAELAWLKGLTEAQMEYSTKSGLGPKSTFNGNNAMLLRGAEGGEVGFIEAVNEFERKQQMMSLLSKSAFVNVITLCILIIWAITLITSITPVNIRTKPGRRDLVEALLELGEKMLYFNSITAKSQFWQVGCFCIVAVYAVVKKGLEVHVDTAPERVVNSSWAFIGALVAKAIEYLAYAARLQPASKAWNFWVRGEAQSGRKMTYLSTEQLARRHLWPGEFFRKHLLDNYQGEQAESVKWG